MFKLSLFIDGVMSVYQSASQKRMIMEVIDLFKLKGNDRTRIPFTGYINEKGQIVEICIDSNVNPKWWDENYPVHFREGVRIKGLIKKIDIEDASDSYDVPKEMLDGDGSCWVAIKNFEIVKIFYMSRTETLNQSRVRGEYIEELSKYGTPVYGSISGKKFHPKEARRIDGDKDAV